MKSYQHFSADIGPYNDTNLINFLIIPQFVNNIGMTLTLWLKHPYTY